MYMYFGFNKGFYFLMSSGEKYGVNVGVGVSVFWSKFNGVVKDMILDLYLGEGYEMSGGVKLI